MLNLVRNLKSRHGLRVAAVSNEGREIMLHRIKTFKLREFMDFIVASCFVHFRKPDEDIFRIAVDISQSPPEEVIYIDDRKMFVEVAEGLGIRGIHHTDYESTRKAFAEFGLSLEEEK
jgi:putative hydrolase of the HAD superfamily